MGLFPRSEARPSMKHDIKRPCSECPFKHPTASGFNYSNRSLKRKLHQPLGCHLSKDTEEIGGQVFAAEDSQACFGATYFKDKGKRFAETS